jgi:hypothetical protein
MNLKQRKRVVTIECDQPSPCLLACKLDCSTQKAQTSGGRTKGSSRCSRKPLQRRCEQLDSGTVLFKVLDADEAVLG